MKVAALIPAFNEAATIAQVVTGIVPHVPLVVVVDDGSSDETADLARRAGATVIVHAANRGKGAAVRSGLTQILAGTYTHVLMLDGDMQHLPDEAPRLLAAAAQTGADLVVGERQFRRDEMPASRYHANRIGSRALSSFMGVRLGDSQCGYRVFRTDLVRRMKLRARGYDIETEMVVKAGRLGGTIAHVPVSAVYGARSKLRPVRDTTRTCFRAVYYRFIESL